MNAIEQTELLDEIDAAFGALEKLRAKVMAIGPLGRQEDDKKRRACHKKRRYSTPEAAGQAAAFARQNGGDRELRVYRCPCSYYHLTSMTMAEFAAANESERGANDA